MMLLCILTSILPTYFHSTIAHTEYTLTLDNKSPLLISFMKIYQTIKMALQKLIKYIERSQTVN